MNYYGGDFNWGILVLVSTSESTGILGGSKLKIDLNYYLGSIFASILGYFLGNSRLGYFFGYSSYFGGSA